MPKKDAYGNMGKMLSSFTKSSEVKRLEARIKELEETEQRLLQKLADASQEHTKQRTILQAEIDNLKALEREILEKAVQRVYFGVVDIDPKTSFNNMLMFDYPRYTWDELHNLIKGIKR